MKKIIKKIISEHHEFYKTEFICIETDSGTLKIIFKEDGSFKIMTNLSEYKITRLTDRFDYPKE